VNVSGVLGERMAARFTGLGWHGFAHESDCISREKRKAPKPAALSWDRADDEADQ
jgi:hypothetical protein